MAAGGYGAPPAYDSRNYAPQMGRQGDRHMPPRTGAARPAGAAAGRMAWSLRPEKSPSNIYTFGNL
jgi:hypothetical protein